MDPDGLPRSLPSHTGKGKRVRQIEKTPKPQVPRQLSIQSKYLPGSQDQTSITESFSAGAPCIMLKKKLSRTTSWYRMSCCLPVQHPMSELSWSPAVLLLTQLSANAPGKAVKNNQSTETSNTPMGNLGGAPGY